MNIQVVTPEVHKSQVPDWILCMVVHKFSASLYNCQLVYTQFLQFYIVIVIVKYNKSVFTLILHFTLLYSILSMVRWCS